MTETFRQSVRPYFETSLITARLFAVLFGALLLVKAWPDITAETFIDGAIALAVGAACFVAALTFLGAVIAVVWTVKVDPRGISGSTYLGWRKRAAWDQIESVEYVVVTGIPYLVLSVRGHRLNIYLPADMRRGKRFDELVIKFAGRDHPLSEWLLPDGEA